MKKRLALLLAAVMLLSSMSLTAGAAETGTPTPEPGCEAVEPEYPSPEPEEYDWEAERAAQLRQERVDAGMPFPDGANISLNGAYLNLGGVAPLENGNLTQAPFRALLEELGGRVDYRDGQFVADMPDGTHIASEPGSTTLTYTVGDKINSVEMFSASTVVDRVTYVDIWALAEALGLDASEDYRYGTVHLTDWTALGEEIDGRFTILNTILAANQRTYDPEKNYDVHLGGSFAGTLYKENGSDTARLTCTADGVVSNKALEGSLQIKLDQGGMRDTSFAGISNFLKGLGTSDEGFQQGLDLLSDFKVDLRADLAGGKAYLRGNSLSKIPDSTLPDNTWLMMDGGRGLTDAFSLPEQEPLTTSALLRQFESRSYGSAAPATWARETADALVLALGDDCFTVQKSGDITTYTLAGDLKGLLSKVNEQDPEAVSRENIEEITQLWSKISWNAAVRLRGNDYLDGKLNFSARMEGLNPTDYILRVDDTQETSNVTFEIKGTYSGSMEFTLDAGVRETGRVPASAPGTGEKVENLEDLL